MEFLTLEKTVGPMLFFLDDAFQHRKVKCDQYVLLILMLFLLLMIGYLPNREFKGIANVKPTHEYYSCSKMPQDLSAMEQHKNSKKN